MSDIISTSRCTTLATNVLQLERTWSNQASDMFAAEFPVCSVELDIGFYRNIGRLISAGYFIKNDGFDNAQGVDMVHISHDDDVDIELV